MDFRDMLNAYVDRFLDFFSLLNISCTILSKKDFQNNSNMENFWRVGSPLPCPQSLLMPSIVCYIRALRSTYACKFKFSVLNLP